MTLTVRPTGTPLPAPERPASQSRPPRSVTLRRLARRVRNHPRQTVANLLSLGRLLERAKAAAGPGQFEAWFRSTGAPYSLRGAREAMLVARRCGELGLPLGRFRASAVKILTRRQVLKTPALIEALAAAAREGGAVGYGAACDAVTSVNPGAVYRDVRAETEVEAFARRLRAIVDDPATSSLYVSKNPDEDLPTVTVTVLRGAGRPRSVSRRCLISAVEAAAGEEKARVCPRCRVPKPPAQYSRSAHNCKVCERRRVKEHEARKRAGKNPGSN